MHADVKRQRRLEQHVPDEGRTDCSVPADCPFFDSNGFEYRIYMGPNWELGTTFAQVTCNTVASDVAAPTGLSIRSRPATTRTETRFRAHPSVTCCISRRTAGPALMKATSTSGITFTSRDLSSVGCVKAKWILRS